MAALIGRLTGA